MIDRTLTTPVYAQIADDLHQRILDGEFDGSHQLPCLKTLAPQYEASTSTVQRAIKQLADEGVVVTYPGGSVRLPNDEEPQPRRIDELTDAVAHLTAFVEKLGKQVDDLSEIVEAFPLQTDSLRKRVRTLEDANRAALARQR